DPFADDPQSDPAQQPPLSGSTPGLSERGRARTRAMKGPGLSPGIPNIRDDTSTREVPRSGVVLTPSGVKRVADEPPVAPVRRVVSTPVDVPADDDADDFHAASRNQNDADHVS